MVSTLVRITTGPWFGCGASDISTLLSFLYASLCFFTFSKFYRRHYDVGLQTLLHQDLSKPEFYGDLVYKFKKIVGRADFSDQFKTIIVRYKRI